VPAGLAPTRTFFPELESLRGIAVLMVMMYHLNSGVLLSASSARPSLVNSFVLAGHAGVDLFFVLSGFLLSLPLIADSFGGRRASLSRYFQRRALRILPLYWCAVVVTTVLSASTPRDLLRGLPYLVFLQGIVDLGRLPISSGIWWSLVTEVQFYLILPLLPFMLRTSRGVRVGAVLLAVYLVAYTMMVCGQFGPGPLGNPYLLASVFARGPLFLAGVLAAFLYHRHGVALRARLGESSWLRRGGADLLLWTIVIAQAAVLRWVASIGLARLFTYADQWWHPVSGALWAALLLLLLLVSPRATKPLFCNAALSRLGVLSYSIYMIHAPFFLFTLPWAGRVLATERSTSWTPTWVALAVALCLCVFAMASLSYRFIECPFLVRKGRIGGDPPTT